MTNFQIACAAAGAIVLFIFVILCLPMKITSADSVQVVTMRKNKGIDDGAMAKSVKSASIVEPEWDNKI